MWQRRAAPHPEVVLSPTEKSAYGELWKEADESGEGKIFGVAAVAFLKKSGQPKETLKNIWNICDVQRNGYLVRNEFNLALRLIAMAQRSPALEVTLDHLNRFAGMSLIPAFGSGGDGVVGAPSGMMGAPSGAVAEISPVVMRAPDAVIDENAFAIERPSKLMPTAPLGMPPEGQGLPIAPWEGGVAAAAVEVPRGPLSPELLERAKAICAEVMKDPGHKSRDPTEQLAQGDNGPLLFLDLDTQHISVLKPALEESFLRSRLQEKEEKKGEGEAEAVIATEAVWAAHWAPKGYDMLAYAVWAGTITLCFSSLITQ